MANFEVGCYPIDDYPVWVERWRNASADWASGQMNWLYPNPFDKFHFPYMCGMCKRGKITDTKVMHCTKCKIATHCCREHQTKAWKAHKEVCKYFETYFGTVYDASVVTSPAAWKYHLLFGQGVLRRLAGSTDPLRIQMNTDEWMYQRHCQACFFNSAARHPLAHQKDNAPLGETSVPVGDVVAHGAPAQLQRRALRVDLMERRGGQAGPAEFGRLGGPGDG